MRRIKTICYFAAAMLVGSVGFWTSPHQKHTCDEIQKAKEVDLVLDFVSSSRELWSLPRLWCYQPTLASDFKTDVWVSFHLLWRPILEAFSLFCLAVIGVGEFIYACVQLTSLLRGANNVI